MNSFSLLLHTTSMILLPFNQLDPQGLHHWSLSFTHQFSQISRSRNAHSGMQLLTCGISFRHLFIFHLHVLSHLSHSLIHIIDQSVTCLMVHFILVLKLIFSSSPFVPRSVSSFTHWSAGTFNCPLCGRIWRFKCTQVRQIKPAQLAFGYIIFTYFLIARFRETVTPLMRSCLYVRQRDAFSSPAQNDPTHPRIRYISFTFCVHMFQLFCHQ